MPPPTQIQERYNNIITRMEEYLLAQSPLNLGRGFGNHGLLASARPLCGWQLETAVG